MLECIYLLLHSNFKDGNAKISRSTGDFYTLRHFKIPITTKITLADHEPILRCYFSCQSKFDLSSKSSSDKPGLVQRSRGPGESLTPSKLWPTCWEPRLLFLVAMVTCREEKLLKPAERHRSLDGNKRQSKSILFTINHFKCRWTDISGYVPLLLEVGDESSINPHSMFVISCTGACPLSMAILHKTPKKYCVNNTQLRQWTIQ